MLFNNLFNDISGDAIDTKRKDYREFFFMELDWSINKLTNL